jgi:hypothetical protein
LIRGSYARLGAAEIDGVEDGESEGNVLGRDETEGAEDGKSEGNKLGRDETEGADEVMSLGDEVGAGACVAALGGFDGEFVEDGEVLAETVAKLNRTHASSRKSLVTKSLSRKM